MNVRDEVAAKVFAGDALKEDEHSELASVLRDWSALARRGRLDEARRSRLFELAGRVRPHAPSDVDRLGVSYHPAAGHPMVRVVESSALDQAFCARCALATPGVPERVLVYVDPSELHFRNYDHILPLDDVLGHAPLSAHVAGGFDEIAPGVWVGSLGREGELEGALRRLDALELYIPPLHARERGGGRFIFHSIALAEALSEAFAQSLPDEVSSGLSHVNPVFRMNRFAPTDEGFAPHHDAPYRDAANAEHSRYTVLVYLTGGEASPALGFESFGLGEIAPMTCVIFEQKLKHHAKSYLTGDKIFIRTELVHTDTGEVREDRALASAFSRACYMTHESLVLPELESYMGACYARASRAHWEGVQALDFDEPERPMILKCFREVPFLTDGHDVWFSSEDVGLEEAAALVVLDFFDVEIDEVRFKDSCEAEVVQAPTGAARADFIARALSARARPTRRPFGSTPFDALLPPGERPDEDICCPAPECDYNDESTGDFDATRSQNVIALYDRACWYVRKRLMRAPVVMMGQDVWLNPSRFVVTENQIHVLSEDRLEPVHFAAMNWCWYGHDRGEYVVTELGVDALAPLLPPIVWRRGQGLLHLKCDFFQNTWTTASPRCDVREVCVPRILSKDDVGLDQGWFEAMGLDTNDL